MSDNQVRVDNAIKAIKTGESWLESIDLRGFPIHLREVIKEGRSDAKVLRQKLTKVGSR